MVKLQFITSAPTHSKRHPTKTIGINPDELTWAICLKYEPRLARIVNRIEKIKSANFKIKGKHNLRYSYAQDIWYGYHGHQGIREQLNSYIGWSSDSDYHELRTMQAHGVCYSYLFDLLTN